MADPTCEHIETIREAKPPKRRECEECVKIGATQAPAPLPELRSDPLLR